MTSTNNHSVKYDTQHLRRLWHFMRPHRKLLFVSLLLLPLESALQLLPPYLMKYAIDEAIIPNHYQLLIVISGLLIGTLILQQFCSFAHSISLQLSGQRAMHDLRIATHRHMLKLSCAYYDRTPVGRLITRVTNDVESISEAFSNGIFAAISDGLTLFGIVTAMLFLNWKLALFTFCMIPILVVLVGVFQRFLRESFRLIRRQLAHINATLQEQINGMKIVQIFSREHEAKQRFDEASRAYRDAYRQSIRYDAALYALVELLGSVTIAALIWFAGRDVIKDALTFGVLVAFIEYVQKFFIPIRDLSAKFAVMQQAMAASERVFDLLDITDLDSPHLTVTKSFSPSPNAAVEFQSVTFGYTAKDAIFNQLSFVVSPQESIGIVGATGSGKSTLIRLLTRLYDIQDGAIFVYGKSIAEMPPATLRHQVVVLGQDPVLFAGSVMSNITLNDPAISEEIATAAARRVGLMSHVPLQHHLTYRGSNISQGERQLVMFARALARDPKVLVLDEATASIDPESEALIQTGIAELMKQRTSIIIAHRLSTIERVDRLMVFDRGAIVEQGTHAELLQLNGHYAKLHALQYVSGD